MRLPVHALSWLFFYCLRNNLAFAGAGENNLIERDLIIGGEDIPFNSFDWFVQIGKIGGVLVAPQFFITKASYEEEVTHSSQVKIGALCNNDNNCGQYYEDGIVESTFVYPGESNLMLVKLAKPSLIAPVEMDDGSLLSSNGSELDLYTAGFGVMDNVNDFTMSEKLLQLQQNYLENDVCMSMAEDRDAMKVHTMCAINNDASKSACYHDGGGPLVDLNSNKLVGIVSTGSTYCETYPVIYERIGAVYPWVVDTICNHQKGETDGSNYFRIVSLFNDGSGWCLTRENPSFGSRVNVERCDHQNSLQLWKVDSRGQIKSYNDDDLCMRNIEKKGLMKMKKCKAKSQQVGFTFMFDPLNESLIWLKRKTNLIESGLQAVAILNEPNDSDSTSRFVLVKKRGDDVLQKWSIEYDENLDFC